MSDRERIKLAGISLTVASDAIGAAISALGAKHAEGPTATTLREKKAELEALSAHCQKTATQTRIKK